ncbi:MAG TPA: hypothetical protein DCY27_05625 [Desulfobacterales bacterium]|nr:hypothetical protein [Desulfobacterales bacterium]
MLLNGEPMGETNVKLELEGGSYEVTLGPPPDFKPEKHQIDLRHTAASRPLRIEFEVI